MNCAAVRYYADLKRALFALLIVVAAFPAAAEGQSDRKQVLGRARARYYNLRQSGLIEFQANITPNWESLLAGVGARGGALTVLKQLHFSMSIDSKSKLRLDHRADVTPPDPKSADRIELIFKEMDEAVSRFVTTWSVFMLTSPFPDIDSEYEVKEVAGQHQFFHKEGALDVTTVTDANFMIVEIKVSGTGINASLKPVLESTTEGFVLKSYFARYETSSGRRTEINAQIDYQAINGLKLPRKVSVNTIFEGNSAQIEWVFTDYLVKVSQ